MKDKRFEEVYTQGNGQTSSQITVLVDKETSVQYLFVQSCSAGGLTALLGPDGKPVIGPRGTNPNL